MHKRPITVAEEKELLSRCTNTSIANNRSLKRFLKFHIPVLSTKYSKVSLHVKYCMYVSFKYRTHIKGQLVRSSAVSSIMKLYHGLSKWNGSCRVLLVLNPNEKHAHCTAERKELSLQMWMCVSFLGTGFHVLFYSTFRKGSWRPVNAVKSCCCASLECLSACRWITAC